MNRNKDVNYIKNYISSEFLEKCNTLYKKFDKSNSNAIPAKDLVVMLRLLDFNPTESEIKDMLQTLEDPKLVGTSDYVQTFTKEGFISCVCRKARDSDTADELIASFKTFDKENKGVIKESVLRFVLGAQGDNLADDEMDNFMKEAMQFGEIINEEKYVKYEEFAKYLMGLAKPQPVDPGAGKGKGKGKKK
jgi:Ca2+-binding EF-hand superfamily protein